jgi:hypothetical protein
MTKGFWGEPSQAPNVRNGCVGKFMNLKGTGAKPDSRLMLGKSHWKNALFGTPQDHDDFAFGLVSGKVGSELSDAAAVEGFVQLADFANDTGGALAAEVFLQFP